MLFGRARLLNALATTPVSNRGCQLALYGTGGAGCAGYSSLGQEENGRLVPKTIGTGLLLPQPMDDRYLRRLVPGLLYPNPWAIGT